MTYHRYDPHCWSLFLLLVLRELRESDDLEGIQYGLDYLATVITFELPEVIKYASTRRERAEMAGW